MATSPPLLSPLSKTNPHHLSTCLLHKSSKPIPLDSMSSYRDKLENGFRPDNFTFPSLLKSLADTQPSSISEAESIHTHIIKMGFHSNVYVINNLMRLYVVCKELNSAHKLFDQFPLRDLVSWTILISEYNKMGFSKAAARLFLAMIHSGIRADEVTITTALSACSKLGDLELGRKLERYIRSNKVKLDACAWNALLDMYLKCGDINAACTLFRKMPQRNVVSWNSMISGFSRNRGSKKALWLFRRMQRERLDPDNHTLVAVLNSCANLGALESGEWVHAYIDKKGIKAEGFVGNALIDMYSKCGRIDRAIGVFGGMRHRDVYSYTGMIVGFAIHGEGEKALNLFEEMARDSVKPNEVTFVGVLSACSHAGLVERGVCHFKDMWRLYGVLPRMEHYGCVVDMLGRAGLFEESLEFINRMPFEPDALIWGSLVGACKIHGNVALGESITGHLLNVEAEKDGSYMVMSNLYASANRRRDAMKMRKAMRVRKVKKTPGSSLVQVNGMVHEFRMGDKSHPQVLETYQMLHRIDLHLRCNIFYCDVTEFY